MNPQYPTDGTSSAYGTTTPFKQSSASRSKSPLSAKPTDSNGGSPSPVRDDGGRRNRQAPPSDKSPREITFQLDTEAAHEVLLVGSFTNWSKAPIQMHKEGRAWQTKILLPPGRYCYKYLVDGEWQDDPRATEHCPNPFGTSDNVLQIS